MKLSDFDYNLPKELIAQAPISPRDHSRLLVLSCASGGRNTNATHSNKNNECEIEHRYFYDIIDYLNPGDILIMNNSKVFPARLLGHKKESGGKMEVFLHHHTAGKVWQCLIGGRGAKPGLEIVFEKKLVAKILENNHDGTWLVEFNKNKNDLFLILNKIGLMPLPPYIKRGENQESGVKNDKSDYQTVFADEKKTGSVAAPTAGLHFTPALLKKIKAKGAKIDYVTLHVGLGTFAPVKIDDITKHKMHAEWVEIKKSTLENIIKAKNAGGRVITVGTTSTRAIENFFSVIARNGSDEAIPGLLRLAAASLAMTKNGYAGWVDIFIYPGYKFKIVDCLITNFHLPKSTLLMLISAFAGKDKIDQAYQVAIKQKYRFFSYGDAMFIN